jgi:class 3 adenylate cyclase/tetratricopeptide (TPR) repeat protein
VNCTNCGSVNPDNKRFCGDCGQPLIRVCPVCQSENPPTNKFCGDCGHALSKPADSPAAGSSPATTSPAASKTVTPAAGERRHASVLFSDLSGFTAMTEQLDPEEVQELMRQLKDGAVEIVEAHMGIVSQFVGDEVLALFGIPVAHEDDPVRAVRAAHEIHALARKLSLQAEDKIGRLLRMHTGIDTGLVVTSTVDARDGTVGVTGDTVNTAARLKAAAADDQILLSRETARLVDTYVQLEQLEPIVLKGKAGPVTPFSVAGEVATGTSRFEAAAARYGFTAFAGREQELAMLQQALEKAIAGQGQFVTVTGEAGVGKSRLLYEFRKSVDRDTVTLLEGRCQSYGSDTPYLPMLDALRRGLCIQDLTSGNALHNTAVENIRAVSPDLEQFIPHLLHLLSIPSEQHKLPETLQGEALQKELEAALAAITTLNATRRPIVMIYEDWHWADAASDAALMNLIGLVGNYSLMLLVLYRPEYQRRWDDVEHYTSITLPALDAVDTSRMLTSVLGVEALPEGLAEAVHERTGGNALFNEEMAHALCDEGILEVDNSVARLTRPVDDLSLPDTVHAVIRARVDRLDPDDREILRLASVIGRQYDRAVLERIAPSAQAANAALMHLTRQGLVHQVRVVPRAEYLFKHVLTQQVVYETLLHSQRKALHAKVGAAIEVLYADRLEEYYERLADHYASGDCPVQAAQYLLKVGGQLRSLGQIEESISCLQRAEELTDHEQIRCTARIGQAEGLRMIDRVDEALEVLKRAQGPAEAGNLAAELAQLHYLRGNLYFPKGEFDKCLVEHESGLKWAREAGSQEAEARSLGGLADASYLSGRMRTAHLRFAECVELSRQHDFAAVYVANEAMIGWTGIYVDPLDKFLDAGRRVAELAAELNQPRAEAIARGLTGFILVELKRFDEAHEEFQRGVEASSKTQAKRFEPLSLWGLGKIAYANGNHSEAMDIGEKALRICRNTAMAYLGPTILGYLARVAADVKAQRRYLAEAEELLANGCVSHNYFFVYKDSIEACLSMRDWDAAEKQASALDAYTRSEPLPWSDFVIARGRALAAHGRSQRSDELTFELQRLRQEGEKMGYKTDLQAIEIALEFH